MPSTLLLDHTNAPLTHLTLHRLQLAQDEPTCTLHTQGEELCLYSLIGTVLLREVRVGEESWDWGTLGTRRAVTAPGVDVWRFPAGPSRWLEVQLADFSADLLVVSAPGPVSAAGPVGPGRDVWSHQVGTGTHQREVRDVSTPVGYRISCGETLNIPGGISSWPPHATAADLAKFQTGLTTWEEVFFVIAPSPGLAVLDGWYSDGTRAERVLRLDNGQGYAMPLGSHMCYAAPDSYLYYAWFYVGDALKKEYKRYADDVGVYRR